MSGDRRARGGLAVVPRDPPAINGLLPPHDLDAEAAVLSACFLKDSAITMVLDLLEPEHFYSEPNARVWQAIATLHGLGTPVDNVSVATWLKDRGWLEKCGGTAYLGHLADACPVIGHARAYAVTVLRKARRRRAIATAQIIAAEGYADVGDEDEWLGGLEDRIGEAVGSAAVQADYSIDSAIAESFASLDETQAGTLSGLSTGLAPLDVLTGGLQAREIILLGAPSGGGKSTLAGQLLFTAATHPAKLKHGVPECEKCAEHARPCKAEHTLQLHGAVAFALEGERRDWSDRAICAHARIDLMGKRNGTWQPWDFDAFASSANRLNGLPVIIDPRKDLNAAKLGARVRAWRDHMARRGVKLRIVVLDYFQLGQWDSPGGNREEDLNAAMRSLVNLRGDPELSEIAWIVITQLNKDGGSRESAALEMHADSVWTITIDEEPKVLNGPHAARVFVKKQRRGPRLKSAAFWFTPQHTLFHD